MDDDRGGKQGIGCGQQEARVAALFLPLSIVFAFMSLNAGYLCRVFPIDARATLWRTVIVHVVAAAMVSATRRREIIRLSRKMR